MDITDKFCRLCGSSMVQVGKKFVCTNDSCSHIELSSGKAWYMNIADDSSYWNSSIMNKAPSIIACEYYKLYDLFKQGAVHAFPLKIKDIFEVEIKFLTLIKLSQAFHSTEYKKAYADLLFTILHSPPSMGTWVSVGQALVKLGEKDIISHQLEKILRICLKNNIVNWRNNTIGHGALYITESCDFQMDIEGKIRLLADYYSSSADTYEGISLFVKGIKKKKLIIPLVGHCYTSHKTITQGKIFISYGKNTFELLPLVKYISEEIYLYDSYDYRRSNATFLSYNVDQKIRDKDSAVRNMYEYLQLDMNVRAACVPVDETFINVSRLNNVDAIICPKNIIRINSLIDDYNGILSNVNKGVFLIQMEDGMGKTTFVKAMDTLSYYHGKQRNNKDQEHMIRAVYINSVYSYKPRYFIAELVHALRTTNDKEIISGDIPAIDIHADDAKIRLVKFINDMYDYNKTHNSIKKLIIFIDGIDEIPYTDGRTIVDIIPRGDALHNGVYIFITSRSEVQLSKFTKETILPKLKFDKSIAINSCDNSYINDLKCGIMNFLKDDKIADKIIELAQNKIINIEHIIQAYQHYGMSELEKCIGIEGYWNFIKYTYGVQYSNEIIKIAVILSIIPIPISVTVLAKLLGEEHVTFKLFVFISELKQFISSQRDANGTLIIISRNEVRDFLRRTKTKSEVEHEWMQQLYMLKDTRQITEEEDAKVIGIILAMSLADGFGDKKVLNESLGKYIGFLMENCNSFSKWMVDLNNIIFDNIISKEKLGVIKKIFNPNQLAFFIYACASQMRIGGYGSRFIEGTEFFIKEFEKEIIPFLCQKIYMMLGQEYYKVNDALKAYHYTRKAEEVVSDLALITDYSYNIGTDPIELMNVEVLLSEAMISKNNKQYTRAIKLIEKASESVDNIFPLKENDVGIVLLKQIFAKYTEIYTKDDNPIRRCPILKRGIVS